MASSSRAPPPPTPPPTPPELEGVCRRTLANMLSGRFGESTGGGGSLVSTARLPRLISKQGSRRRMLVSRMKVFATFGPVPFEEKQSLIPRQMTPVDLRVGVGGGVCGFSCQMIAARRVQRNICWWTQTQTQGLGSRRLQSWKKNTRKT